MANIIEIKPMHRDGVIEMARHSFGIAPNSSHAIDSGLKIPERVLFGSAELPGALGELPERQPDTGRLLQSNTRHAAYITVRPFSDVNVLDIEALELWASMVVEWLRHDRPGQPVYAVLHVDNIGPHIHAVQRPVDKKTGHISYKAMFLGGRVMLDQWRRSYQRHVAHPIEKRANKGASSDVTEEEAGGEETVSLNALVTKYKRLERERKQMRDKEVRLTEELDSTLNSIKSIMPESLLSALRDGSEANMTIRV